MNLAFLTGSAVLLLESRRRIYDLILTAPALHFREIQRRLGFATGALEYHLSVMLRAGIISSQREGGTLRFCPSQLPADQARVLSLLRQERLRKLLLFLMLRPHSSHGEIAKDLGISPSTLSWHIKRLVSAGVVRPENRGNSIRYHVSDPEELTRLLAAYKPSFLDRSVDNFVNMWGSM